MDWDLLQQVVGILKASGVSEIALEYEDTKIRVRRPVPTAAPFTVVPESPAAEAIEAESELPPAPPRILIKAGRVGILHLHDQGKDEPLVEEGQEVKEGETIAHVESVQLMTEIAAPQQGRVVKILAEDGAAVEYGQALFELELLQGEPGEEVGE